MSKDRKHEWDVPTNTPNKTMFISVYHHRGEYILTIHAAELEGPFRTILITGPGSYYKRLEACPRYSAKRLAELYGQIRSEIEGGGHLAVKLAELAKEAGLSLVTDAVKAQAAAGAKASAMIDQAIKKSDAVGLAEAIAFAPVRAIATASTPDHCDERFGDPLAMNLRD